MPLHPAFLIVRAKIAEAKEAVAHMMINDAQQKSLALSNPNFYSVSVHAECMATNVQGLYTNLEGILKSLTNTIDGFTPGGESSHRDLLLQVSMPTDDRSPIIQQETLKGLFQLLRFRHAMRNNYAGDLRSSDVFDNVANAGKISAKFFEDIETFVQSFQEDERQDSEENPSPYRPGKI